MPTPASPPVRPLPIDALRFRNHLVESLPGDPLEVNRTRAVLHACYSPVTPTPVAAPELLTVVPEVAELLDLAPETTPELTAVLSGNRVLPGMRPYAACYGGHQFGNWAGQLGDGRAITLAEVENTRGESFELQLKGAGRTPYSRSGDGRAVLRSSLRELVCSEGMHWLGVPTTRALSVALAGERVVRDMLYDGHPAYEPAAIVARVAPSFLRFGNFEIHAARGDEATLAKLVRFTIERYFPQFAAGAALDIAGFFGEVCQRTARLVVEWMRVGFVHGVLNTDNMSVLGLTIDYGPYGFLDVFDPHWTPNTTDAGGRRYRYGQQPHVAHWNLAQLAGALAPLLDGVSALEQSLEAYADTFSARSRQMWLSKLGLSASEEHAELDDAIIESMFSALTATELDMSLFFRRLAELPLARERAASNDELLHGLADAFYDLEAASAAQRAVVTRWLERLAERVRIEGRSEAERQQHMHAINPLYLPRNYLLQEVIDQTEAGDRQALPKLLQVLRRPYVAQPGCEAYAQKRPEWARNKPGCSMLSCSS